MSTVEAFKNAGAKAGLEIFRIEKLVPRRTDPAQNGTFYSGDSYICLKTTITPQNTKEWHIHFWLGKDSSQDEQGTAAIMTVELDDMLGGAPIQHRETQGHESKLFMSYFKSGIQCLEGGIESGFNHVDPDAYTPRLLHVKGKRDVRVTQVNPDRSSMNHGDVFILDAGLTLYQWNGKDANKYEKMKGVQMVQKIRNDERGGKPVVHVLEAGVDDNRSEVQGFWDHIGGFGNVAAATSDDEVKAATKLELFCVSDASGSLEMTSIATKDLEKSMLNSDDVFILDTGGEVFVWVGKGANKAERKESMRYASEYLKQNNRPAWCPVTRIMESGETPVFKAFFKNFDPPRALQNFGGGGAAKKVKQAADTSAMYSQKKKEEEKLLDDGSGKLTIWRVEDFKPAEWPKDQYGQFYAGDSFVVLYEYVVKNKDYQILYFWQGKDSSQDERASAALIAMNMDDEMTAAGKDPVQVRVVQNKEPNHFYAIFKGKFVVHTGGKASGFKNVADSDSYDTDGVGLYHVKGTNKYNTRAVQVEEAAHSLNSGDVFILVTPQELFVWNGSGASAEEKSYGQEISKLLRGERTETIVAEGQESAAFWEFLGGKEDYPHSKELVEGAKEPRLFQCSNATGRFVVEELFNFSQEDLAIDDVFLLDTYSEVWIWVGLEANDAEKKDAFQAALDYVKNAPDGRSEDTPVLRLDCGNEPPMFTAHFIGWDDAHFKEDPYLKKLREMKGMSGETSTAPQVVTSANQAISFLDPDENVFTYEQLKNKKIAGVDPGRKEEYLEDDEFEKLFGMSFDEFQELKAWKQKSLKKKFGLF